ncbi:unnamed protein product [Ilex paraguariensis]|uniref:Secreted protein n=1 Tax=Ilex paraguariensis TaxID=185542 RepID=A0ABC8SZ63_9AQUA
MRVSVVSPFMGCPRILHWNALICILCYFKRAPGLGLLYQTNGHLKVEGFTNTDCASSPSGRRLTTKYCTF